MPTASSIILFIVANDTVTNYHKLVTLNNKNVFSYSVAGQKYKFAFMGLKRRC